jgi:hypothetical protein
MYPSRSTPSIHDRECISIIWERGGKKTQNEQIHARIAPAWKVAWLSKCGDDRQEVKYRKKGIECKNIVASHATNLTGRKEKRRQKGEVIWMRGRYTRSNARKLGYGMSKGSRYVSRTRKGRMTRRDGKRWILQGRPTPNNAGKSEGAEIKM